MYFFQFSDSFSNAKIKLKKAEYQSDIDSPYNTDEKKKQRRDNAKVKFSDNSDNEEQIREKRRKMKPKKTNLPSLPEVPIAGIGCSQNCTMNALKYYSTFLCSIFHKNKNIMMFRGICSAVAHS